MYSEEGSLENSGRGSVKERRLVGQLTCVMCHAGRMCEGSVSLSAW